ncbi:MAG: hypothetical protein ABH858_04425, partial [Candidatus Omnitrophota bacterium]
MAAHKGALPLSDVSLERVPLKKNTLHLSLPEDSLVRTLKVIVSYHYIASSLLLQGDSHSENFFFENLMSWDVKRDSVPMKALLVFIVRSTQRLDSRPRHIATA